MDTLHKKLSAIRDLRTDELDLVGGAGEGYNPPYGTQVPSMANIGTQTSSMYQGQNGQMVQGTDDGETKYVQVDTSWD